METLQRSKIVKALADLASSGRYTVDPQGARNMTALYEIVAKLINELEEEETRGDIKAEAFKQRAEVAADVAIDRIFDGEEPKAPKTRRTKAGGEIK